MTDHIDTKPPAGHRMVQRGYDCTVYYYANGDTSGDLCNTSFTIGDMDELFVQSNFIKLNCGPDAIGNMSYALIPERFVTEIDIDPHYEYEPTDDEDDGPFVIPF